MRAEPERITVEQLLSLLGHVRGCRISIVYAETIPRLRQKLSQDDHTPCPFFNVDSTPRDTDSKRWYIRKRTTFSVALVGRRKRGQPSAYESAVNRRRAKEWKPLNDGGTLEYFTSQGRTWGKRRQSSPLVDHGGKVYLDVQRLRLLSYQYVDLRTGRTLTLPQVEPWLIGHTPGKSQQVDNQIVWRDYRIDRIRRVTGLNGTTYDIARRCKINATRETRPQQIDRRRIDRLPKRKRAAARRALKRRRQREAGK